MSKLHTRCDGHLGREAVLRFCVSGASLASKPDDG
jgi:hypothetical protein